GRRRARALVAGAVVRAPGRLAGSRALAGALLAASFVASFVGATPAFATETPHHRARHVLHGTVNLNQADEEALELLPQIGEAKAARILEWRKAHPFKRVEDLTRVKGIGRRTL